MLKYEIAGGDSGYNESDAIQPYDNAEDADQAVFRRPPENLRYRTEQLRKAVDDLQMVSASDRALFLLTDPTTTIEWGGAKDVDPGTGFGTGIPTMAGGSGISILPLLSNSIRVDATGAVSRDNTPIWAKLAKLNDTATISFTSNKYLYEGANNIAIRCYDAGEGSSGATVESVEGTLDGGNPSGLVVIVVKLSDATQTTQQEVVDAIAAHGTASTLVTATTTDGLKLAPEIDPAERLRGGVDSECHELLQTDWNNFFDIAGNELNEGDCVVLKFADAATRLADDATDYLTPRLMIIRKDHADANNPTNEFNTDVVPICKVTSDTLCFTNGTGVFRDETVNLLPDRTIRADLAKDTTPDSGDTLVGAAVQADTGSQTGSVPFSLPANSTVRDHLKRLLGDLNRHVETPLTDDYKHKYAELLNTPSIIVDAGGTGQYTTITAAFNAIKSTGGVIWVRGATHTEDITLDGTLGPTETVYIVGEGRPVLNATSGPIFTISGDNAANIYIENFKLEQTLDQRLLDDQSTSLGQGQLHVRDCYVVYHNTTAGVPAFRVRNKIFRMERCHCSHADGQSSCTYNQAWIGHAPQAGTEEHQSVYIGDCYFKYGGKLFSGASDATYKLQDLQIVRNHCDSVGYSPSATNIGHLISVADCRNLIVSENLVDGMSATNNNTAKFLVVYNEPTGNVEISRNLVFDGVLITPSSSSHYMVEMPTSGSNYRSLHNNVFECGKCLGCSGSFDVVVGNQFRNIGLTDGDVIYNPRDAAIIRDNVVDFVSQGTTVTTLVGIPVYANQCVMGNTIGLLPYGAIGIEMLSTSARARVHGNHVSWAATGATSGVGIQVGGGWSSVQGNYIDYAPIGIEITSSKNIVSGNRTFATNAGHEGIVCSADTNSIVNNQLENTATPSAGIFGIDTGATNDHCMTGNMLVGWGSQHFNCTGSNIGLGSKPFANNYTTYNWNDG